LLAERLLSLELRKIFRRIKVEVKVEAELSPPN
jgi:hypothetical protein